MTWPPLVSTRAGAHVSERSVSPAVLAESLQLRLQIHWQSAGTTSTGPQSSQRADPDGSLDVVRDDRCGLDAGRQLAGPQAVGTPRDEQHVVAGRRRGLLLALLAGVSPADPLTFASAASLAMAMVLAGSAVPALRAMRVDPAVATRAE